MQHIAPHKNMSRKRLIMGADYIKSAVVFQALLKSTIRNYCASPINTESNAISIISLNVN
ncbi:hypothetical protein NTHI1209_01772 [Haemophilus influenzae]|uniref:Uncharacterized protein n=1 Tax=Haemophilus influenzae TaxID=727 RepID=A0A158SZ38_HAEIF|nr:hypothetical protein NTHI1209_01772 [Haemophilus influenzae]